MEFEKATVTAWIIAVICVFGLVGNFLSVLVILRIKKKKTNPFHSLLLGLSFSDSLLLIMTILRTLHQLALLNLNNSPRYLEILFFVLGWISAAGTKYFTVAVSLERYFVICHPLRAQMSIRKYHGVMLTLGVFIFVILLTIFSFMYNNYIHQPSFSIYSAIVLDLIPFLLVLVFSTLMYFGLRKYQKSLQKLTEGEINEVSVSKMLLTVVLVFGICYSFDFIRRIMVYSGVEFNYAKYVWYDYTINCLAGVGFTLNSAVNFIIYCLMGATFFREFKQMIREGIYKMRGICCIMAELETERTDLEKNSSTTSTSTTMASNSS